MDVTRTFDPGMLTVRFCDGGGEEFASLHVNPTDAGLLNRAAEVAEFFRGGLPEDAAAADAAVEERISYLLGYDAHAELFSRVTATTVSPEGEMFARAVLDAVADAVAPELSRRAELLRRRVEEYAAKYEA